MPDRDLEKWVWLTALPKMESRKITYLLDVLNDIDTVYKATEQQYETVPGLSKEDRKNLLDKSLTRADKIIEYCQNLKVRILTYPEQDYPSVLRKIFDPPYVLYTKGNFTFDDETLSIGVVGSRIPSDYGRKAAYHLSYDLAQKGVVIVSGMARGLDGIAAQAAIKAGGRTIAVLGCGIDVVYPSEHDALEQAIMEQGMVLTEYPPGTPPIGSNFPKRNRIISGLSQGIIVIEASKASGSLITAGTALSQDRDVFAVPGSIYSGLSQGTNHLIGQGAKLVQCAQDVLDEYTWQMKKWHSFSADVVKENAAIKEQKMTTSVADVPLTHQTIEDDKYQSLSEDQKKIIACLLAGTKTCEEIAVKTDLGISKTLSTVTMLEIQGFIHSLPGKNYAINDENR